LQVIDEATGNDVTGKALCPGTKYHLLYHNAALFCSTGDYISFGRLNVSDGSDDISFTGNAGQSVNSDTYVMSQSLRFTYNVVTMGPKAGNHVCGSSDKNFDIAMAPVPTVSITGDSTFCAGVTGDGVDLTATSQGETVDCLGVVQAGW
jgi:hypothetical protein